MHLKQLEGAPTSRGALHVVEVRPGRFREELDAVLALGDGSPSVWVKYFAGRPSAYIPPWIEASFRRDDERLAADIIVALADLLPPGGRLMTIYGDDETERGLVASRTSRTRSRGERETGSWARWRRAERCGA